MSHISILWWADSVQLFSIVLSVLGFLPQILKLLREKDSTGLAMRSWLVWTFGSAMGLFYALTHYLIDRSCAALAITASVSFSLNLITLLLIWTYPGNCRPPVNSPQHTTTDPDRNDKRFATPVVSPCPPGVAG